ncbi:MAG TPA: type II secretion system F family protein [Acidimicrobiales bacterium]
MLSNPFVILMIAGVTAGSAVVAAIVVRMAGEASSARDESKASPGSGRPLNRRMDDAFEKSPMVKRAIELTANLAERRGVLGSVERSLRAADIPLRPAEVIFAYSVLAFVVPLSVLLFLRTPTMFILSLFLFVIVPPYALKTIVKMRRKKFVNQLPDALATLAGSLRAGRSLGQALEALAREMPAPIGRELKKVVAEVRLGRKVSEALDDAVERVGSPDFRWAVLAMQIQAEVGGNLAELLDRVGETMRSRSRLKGEVKALTAEGRASAMMLVIMPPALGAVMYAGNPKYMRPMFTTTAGHIMLGVSLVMIVAGFFWMKKVVTIDV